MKTINGKPATREQLYYRFASSCDKPETLARWEAEGYEKCQDSITFVKKTETVRYSAQVNPKNIGKEPNYGQSVHEHRYETIYFTVSKDEFDAMEVKPQLTTVVRPARFHNFDGFVEQTQIEKKGMGWSEQDIDYHTTTTYVYFVE